ncbi:MAG: GNAT family N-acetyltransferase [Candidatus Riflebacteria bacterium]|nr:GNAT family N-acetyltransferase [Candidatus Riflebacteria bacterium]
MNIRFSSLNDLDQILAIVAQAQKWLKENKINQWQNGYPNKESIEQDIAAKYCYVAVEGGKIIATVSLVVEPDINYFKIYEGKWLTDNKYISIHRIAVEQSYKNTQTASQIINFAQELAKSKNCGSLRVDTHEDNIAMQKFVLKNKFTYCGIIYLQDGAKRLAYEKVLTNI